MQLKCLPYVLIFIILLGTCVQPEFINNKQWKDVLSYLNTIYFQNRRPSLFATDNNTLCSNHFQTYLDHINSSYWAAQMFDSSTKFPEGVLTGQTVFFGNFDECIEVVNVQTEHGHFNGQYCFVRFQGRTASLRTQKPPDIGGFRRNFRDVTGSDRTIVFTAPDTVLSLSYCIPSSCSAKELEDIFNFYLQSANLPVEATVDEIYCQTNEGKRLGAEDWVTVTIFAFIILLVVTSTVYDLTVKGTKKKLLTAFSVYSNGRKLLSTKSPGDTLNALHGMRFITSCWVVWCHRYILETSFPTMNFRAIVDFVQDAGRLYVTNGSLSADTFLVMSGLLVSYVFLKQMKHKSSGFNIPKYYLHRYIRLTPPYVIVILFNATLYRYVAKGPLLLALMDEMAENCQKYWWTNILYINNYVEVERRCVQQSWYLSVDMQLFFLSPMILYPLWKWPRRWSMSLIGALMVAGIISPFTVTYVTEFSANLIFGNEDNVMGEHEVYIGTHSRFGPWVIGVAFGYLIYEALRKKLQLSRIQIAAMWIFSNVAMLGSLNGVHSFYQPDADKTVLDSAFYNGLFRNVWAFGVGVTIFMCVTGYGGAVNKLLSWKIFPTLSRLSYCVYLTHGSYQIVQTFTARTAIYFADITEWPAFFGDVIISLIMAVVLSLCIESPAINLEMFLFRTDRKNRENKTEEDPTEPRKSNEDAHINKSMEQSKASEDGNSNFPEIKLDETDEDSVVQYLNREDVECQM